jgi:Tfp pilus assembly protein PilO
MKQSNPAQNLMIIGILLIVASLVGSYMYLVPQLKDARTELKTAQAKDEGLAKDVTSLQTAETELTSAEASMRSRGIDTDSVQAIIPNFEDVPSFYIQMEDIKAKAAGVSMTYTVGVPVKGTGAIGAKIPVSVTATGSYVDLKGLLANLESNVRPITLESIAFSNSSDPKKPGLSLTAQGFAAARSISPQYSQADGTTSGQ